MAERGKWLDGKVPYGVKLVGFTDVNHNNELLKLCRVEIKRCLGVYKVQQKNCPYLKLLPAARRNWGLCFHSTKCKVVKQPGILPGTFTFEYVKFLTVRGIGIRANHLFESPFTAVIDTITHEMAHVIVIVLYNSTGHGPLFRKVYRHLKETRIQFDTAARNREDQ